MDTKCKGVTVPQSKIIHSATAARAYIASWLRHCADRLDQYPNHRFAAPLAEKVHSCVGARRMCIDGMHDRLTAADTPVFAKAVLSELLNRDMTLSEFAAAQPGIDLRELRLLMYDPARMPKRARKVLAGYVREALSIREVQA